jgi:hypothetical protein
VTRTSEPPTARPQAEPPPDKQVIRLPDGRELTYYRFPETPDGERRPRRMSLGRSEQGERGSRGSPGEADGNRGSPDKKEP